jgi:hypothetical protein
MRDIARRLICEQQFGHHAARRHGALGLGLHFHAGRWHPDAARGQHALALDLHHADPAVAVRAVARHRRVAQMREPDADAARGPEDGLVGATLDLLAVEREAEGLCGSVGAHR